MARPKAKQRRHGTVYGYKHHRCMCARCVEAFHAAQRKYKENGRKDQLRHGSRGSYVNGCHCDLCRAANCAYIRSRPRKVLH